MLRFLCCWDIRWGSLLGGSARGSKSAYTGECASGVPNGQLNAQVIWYYRCRPLFCDMRITCQAAIL